MSAWKEYMADAFAKLREPKAPPTGENSEATLESVDGISTNRYAVQVRTTQILNIWAASESEAVVRAGRVVAEAGGYKPLESDQDPDVEYTILDVTPNHAPFLLQG